MRMNVDVVSSGTSTTVVMSDAQKERLGWESRIPVAFEFDGERFRATVIHQHGRWGFATSTRMRARGLTAGRRYTLDIARDTEPEPLD